MLTIDTMTTERTIAELIHEYLVRTGITDAELGDLVGVHQTQISRWKRGTGVPRASFVSAIAEVLDLPEDEVEEARVEGEKVRSELATRRERDPREELIRVRRELRATQAKVRRLEERLRGDRPSDT